MSKASQLKFHKGLNEEDREELFLIDSILEREGIKYWLDAGGLLVLVRDGQLIDGDLDIDVGLFLDDVSPEKIVTLFSTDDWTCVNLLPQGMLNINMKNIKKLTFASIKEKRTSCLLLMVFADL